MCGQHRDDSTEGILNRAGVEVLPLAELSLEIDAVLVGQELIKLLLV